MSLLDDFLNNYQGDGSGDYANQFDPSAGDYSGGSGFDLNKFLTGLGGFAGSYGPGAAALAYAQNQSNAISPNLDISKLTDLYNQAGTNQGGYVDSIVNPYKQQVQQGLGDLTQSIGQRGLGGSSFGNQALTNYNTDTGRQLSDITSGAMNNSIGLRTGIANNILGAQANDYQRQLALLKDNRNLYARALGLFGNNNNREGGGNSGGGGLFGDLLGGAGSLFGGGSAVSDLAPFFAL